MSSKLLKIIVAIVAVIIIALGYLYLAGKTKLNNESTEEITETTQENETAETVANITTSTTLSLDDFKKIRDFTEANDISKNPNRDFVIISGFEVETYGNYKPFDKVSIRGILNGNYREYVIGETSGRLYFSALNNNTYENMSDGDVLNAQKMTKLVLSEIDNKNLLEINKWKTYRNEEYGFGFKYPKEYFISLPSYQTANETTGGFDSDPQEELLNKDLIIDNTKFDHTKAVTVWVDRIDSLPIESTREKNDWFQDTTQKDLIAQRAEIEDSKTFNGDYVAENKNSVTKIIKIGDKKLKRSIWYSHQSGDFINDLKFFSKNGDLITIESYLLKSKNIEEAKNDSRTSVFDAIVSSFQDTRAD